MLGTTNLLTGGAPAQGKVLTPSTNWQTVSFTNADGGVREYYRRFGHSYISLMKDLDSSAPNFDEEMIERIGQGVDAMEGEASIGDICRWRDRMILKIRKLKEEDPHP